MAKVKLPLISLEARGAIGKALVYFPWKGINAVREYVIPANPKTDLQIAQRAKMTAAVADWHTSAFSSEDDTAWRRYASLIAKPMTAMNAFVRTHVLKAIEGISWKIMHFGELDDVGDTHLSFSIAPEDFTSACFYYFTTNPRVPGSLHDMSYVDGTGRWVTTESSLITKTAYYVKFNQHNAAFFGETGWYKWSTT